MLGKDNKRSVQLERGRQPQHIWKEREENVVGKIIQWLLGK